MTHQNPLIGSTKGDTRDNCSAVVRLLQEYGDGSDEITLSPEASRGFRLVLQSLQGAISACQEEAHDGA